MKKPFYRFRKHLAVYLCFYITFSPFVAFAGGPLTVDGTTLTTIDAARNNVPIVNIANPNATGLSHNTFTDYNVNKEGLILNNSTVPVNTQLGGYIYGNTNLSTNATVILNEVTSSNRSTLNGYTEIAGKKADLIIANPNGLTINGAGFINTSNVTLSTGIPNIVNDALQSLMIKGGDITIEGTGLDTQNLTSTSIYTQYLKLNAKLHANDLDIKLGNNTIDYQSKAITSSNNTGNTAALLLDASLLGGMYANRIMLVGTDQGVGVNLPPEVLASTGDININNDGTISLHKVTAKQQIAVQSANDVTLDNNLYSSTDISLKAGKAVRVNAGITAAKNGITVNADTVNNQATILAGLNEDNTKNTNGAVTITGNSVTNASKIQSTGNLDTVVSGTLNNSGQMLADNQQKVKAANLTNSGSITGKDTTLTTTDITNSGDLLGSNDLTVNNGNNLLNTAGTIQAGNQLTLASKGLDNKANIVAANMGVTTTTATNSGDMQATQGLTVTTDTLTNTANILSGNQTTVKATTSLTNSGTIHSNNNNSVTTASLTNTKDITATNRLDISGGNLTTTSGELSGTDVAITATNVTTSGTNLLAVNSMKVTATDTLNNAGNLQSNNTLDLKAATLTNSGSVTGKDTTLTTTDITNSGDLLGSNDLTVNNGNNLLNTAGTIQAGNQLTLASKGLDNKASIVAANMDVTTTTATNTGDMQATQGLTVTTDTLTNTANILSGNQTTVKATTSLTNSGTIHSNNNNSVTTASLTNTKDITATNRLDISGGNLTTTSGEISGTDVNVSATNVTTSGTNLLAVNSMKVTATDTLNNAGNLQSNNTLDLKAATLTNSGSVTGKDTTLTVTDASNSGNVLGSNNLTVDATNSLLNTAGTLEAGNRLTLNAKSLDNKTSASIVAANVDVTTTTATNSGDMQATQGLTVTTDTLTNTANILSGSQTTVKATTSLTNSGIIHSNNNNSVTTATLSNTKDITATNRLDISGGNLTTTNGEISGTDVNVSATNVTTSGTNLLAVNNMGLTVTNGLNNAGRIEAGNNLTVNAASLANDTSFAAKSATITATGDVTNKGTLHADTSLTVTASNIRNTKEISSNDTLSLTATNLIDNTSSRIASSGNTTVRAAALDNTSGTLTTGANLDVNTTGTLTNRLGTIKSNQDITLTMNSLDNSSGRVEAVRNLYLDTIGFGVTGSSLYAGNDLTFILKDLDNVSSSSIGAGRNLTINASGSIVNHANILANGSLTFNTNGRLVNNLTISSGGALFLNAYTLDNLGTISGGTNNSNIAITTTINNQSRISTIGGLALSGTDIVNNGFFNAGSGMVLTSNNLTNNKTLFSGGSMDLFATGTISNTANANIFAMQNLRMAANSANAPASLIDNNMANIEAYQGNISLFANTLNNITTAPVVQGYFDPATTSVIGGVTNGNVDSMVLISKSAPATLRAGGNLDLQVSTINNQYSLISANGNINLSSLVLDIQPVDIVEVTTTSTPVYVTQVSCHYSWFRRYCNTYSVFAGYSVSKSSSIIDSVPTTIQAGGSITGNVGNLTNGNITGNQVIAASSAQTQTTTTTANTHTVANTVINNSGTVSGVTAKTATVTNATGTTSNIAAKTAKVATVTGTTSDVTAKTEAVNKPPVPTNLNIQVPSGDYGLFVVAKNPESRFLIEKNPEFALYENFISSDYMMKHIGFSPEQEMKRVGDAFYENKLVRDSIFEQTGKRFLNSEMKNDNDQYQYLMDNAVAAQKELQLVPGITLSKDQVASLNRDIVWMEEQVVAGEKVLVPVVYIANARDYRIEGGKIIAGDDIDLAVEQMQNAGLLEAGNSLTVDASDKLVNRGGTIRAKETLSLQAKNDIENVSATISAKNVELTSREGSIINKRDSRQLALGNAAFRDNKTIVGQAGNIEASEGLQLTAAKQIAVTGSKLQAGDLKLKAKSIDIASTVKTTDIFAGDSRNNTEIRSTRNLASDISATNVTLESTGTTTVRGGNITAKEALDVKAAQLDLLAVNDSDYTASKSTRKGFFSSRTSTEKSATSTNVGSILSGRDVTVTTGDDITIVGSNAEAEQKLALESTDGNINVQAGFNGTMNESYSKKSGWFTGGAIFSKSEDLDGRLTKTAALAGLKGTDVSLKAKNDVSLTGVDVKATNNLSATAGNITVANTANEEETYSKHSKLTVGFGDVVQSITRPDKAINVKDGKASVTLAKADYRNADKTTKKTTVVSSTLDATNISLKANAPEEAATDVEGVNENELGEKGNIAIIGSNLTATDSIELAASENVTVTEAKSTETTQSKEQTGKAELKLTLKNEYVQIGYAVKAAKEAKDQLARSKSDYDSYKQDVKTQEGNLAHLKQDLKNGRIGIEQADVDELAGLIDDLKRDEAFYISNIALATADLATKTLAVQKQMATAVASSETAGFNLGLELDIDLLEKQYNSYKEQSVASNLSAANISIDSNERTVIRGSNVSASDRLSLQGREVDLLASQDVDNSRESSDHKNLNVSLGIYSGNLSASVSTDSSQGSHNGVTNRNSQLQAGNIDITTSGTTTVNGANVNAGDTLKINAQDLKVASVQDGTSDRSSSRGMSLSASLKSIDSGSISNGVSRSSSKNTLLTTLTGNTVNIDVAEKTTLKGATVAALDKQGKDNGQLTLSTGSLEASSLNNTKNSKSTSLNVGIGQTMSLDYANDNSNSKTKTLATLGEGNVQVANLDESDTRMLNRDVASNEIDIYDISSHKGLKGSLDTRMLTKDGWMSIAEDMLKSNMILNTIKLIATTEKVGVQDFFSETDKSNKTYEAIKRKVAEDPKLAAALQSPKLTPQQKEEMLNGVTGAVMAALGYKTHKNVIVATNATGRDNHIVSGFYSTDTKEAYINDKNIADTKGLISTAGYESTRAMDFLDGVDFNINREDRSAYATIFGDNLANYTAFSLDINGYEGGLATTNNHVGNNSDTVFANNQTFANLDKTKGDNLIPVVIAVAEGVDKVITAYDAWQLKKAIEEGRNDDAEAIAAEIGVGIATDAIPGNKILLKVRKLFKKADDVPQVDVPDAPNTNVAYENVGSKGNWNGNLNKPEPNKTYQVDTGHTFATDELGRVNKVEGELNLDRMNRNTYQQCKAGNCGNTNDEGGHLIASILGGPGEKINLVPMDANLNRGAWKQMEKDWAGALKEGKKVKVNIEPVYSGNSVRPDAFNVKYSIDGEQLERFMLNQPGG